MHASWSATEPDEGAVASNADGTPDVADDSQFIFLDEAGGWALWLAGDSDEAIVVHAHDPAGDGDAELLFYECDGVRDEQDRPLALCPECGAIIPEAEIDALIDALPDATDD
jgi:hypothetical protein